MEANWLGEKPLASVRKSKFQEAKDLGVICGENPNYIEMVENFWLVASAGATYEKHASIC